MMQPLFYECAANAIAAQFECSANGRVHLFGMDREHAEPCFVEHNPFLSTDSVIVPTLTAAAIVHTSQAADLREREQDAIETQTRRVTIATNPLPIASGWWAYIELYGDLLGGRVVRVVRDKRVFVDIFIDTSKPVPFRPELIGVQWSRNPQN